MTIRRAAVELADLLNTPDFDDVTEHHRMSHSHVVRDVAFVTDIEDISNVGPGTIVVLDESAAHGGWLLSGALRYAWERHAAALIVPDDALAISVLELAKRLDVNFLSSPRAMSRMVLDIAIGIGRLQAATESRIITLRQRIEDAPDIVTAVGLISRELGGCLVQANSSGTLIASAGKPPPASQSARVTSSPRPFESPVELVALVPNQQLEFAHNALNAAVPTARIMLLTDELEAIQKALPLLSMVTLTGLGFARSMQPDTDRFADAMHIPSHKPHVAVCLLVADSSHDVALFSSPVYHVWRRAFKGSPLSRMDGGWITFLSVDAVGTATSDAIAHTLTERVVEPLRAIGVAVGISTIGNDERIASDLAGEAWLAAKVARPNAAATFDRISQPLLSRLIPRELAQRLVGVYFPRLQADSQFNELARCAVAYLDCVGSVSATATRLGLHRNTVQARLRRITELGVNLTEPDSSLTQHLILTAATRCDGV
ncbi:MAG: hypothetical protein B5766_09965 [Candidatus Lumbricidophila eiseniae]|uniref:PucR C-terminal helix-turn-helix domain-containing protein n=1 Tax=Candidatus Lumbricidiphila eiseniae TaxID=1969409 RepID=A0A2A6FPB1_9MICO|nr:MAG: hypothetical protein B5766_09965 [Candidatus Lumbricidophila eiseniae]